MKWINISLEALLIFLIFFSPFIYGSITVLPLTVIELTSFFILFVFLLRSCLEGRISLVKVPFLLLSLFVALIVFQLIPLPAGLLKDISSSTFALYHDFRPGPNEFLTVSIYPDATINLLLQLLSLISVFFVTLNYVDNEAKGKRMILAIIISAFLYAFYGLIRRFAVPEGGFSTFTNRNHFAAYMEMVIPLGIAFVLIEKDKTKKAILVFLASVMVLALIFSSSRGGIICFSLSLFLAAFLFRLKHHLRKGFIVIVSLGLLLSLFLAAIGASSVAKRLETLQNPLKAMAGRIEVLKDASKIIADFPVFGTGLGTFADIFPKYKTFESKAYRFAHNEPLQLLLEVGISGFLLFFVFLLLYFKDVFSLWLKRRNPSVVYVVLGCFIGLVSVCLHSLVEFMFHTPAVSILFFIIIALMFRAVYFKERQEELPVPEYGFCLNKYFKLMFIGVIFLLFLSVESLIISRYQAEAAYINAGKVKSFSLSDDDFAIERKKALGLLDIALSANPCNSSFVALKAELLQDKDLYREAVNLNPSKAEYHFKLGLLYEGSNKEEACKEFNSSLMLDPQNRKIKDYIAKVR